MKNFLYDIGTKIYFGEGQIVHLPEAIKPYAQKVLLVYGGGSIKKSGLYDTVTRLFRENGIQWQELPGWSPIPASPLSMPEHVFAGNMVWRVW